ncbi:enediyne polyketide synthase [Actinopolyspora mzabensis]|uniref:Enediyne polyketide synthase n=1 Tax=Actinopolyspora mzabensis TaxID=995066 RepID=A0A1G8Y7B0_ACTMZ|nr:type I polyketide synthase [Actinopolyspora mzabensis]SDJ98314.1 enediyne polyketide synthase [Actinopolyspora mzabensis]
MGSERIAIVGIGLCYPDAESPDELWENVLAGRRAFRRIPDERLNRSDYWSPAPEAPDRFYTEYAAVLRDFEFDRVHYKVAGSTYRATDLTHWLALEVTARALRDAGFGNGSGLPRESTGVVLGNSLTGEFSRAANTLRLRWPYVRRTVADSLTSKGWDDHEIADLLRDLEERYKAPFPAINEDSLAGGLSNTIAGRICNHFDLHGGGYTVDGACSSSLLSVATGANALVEGDLDVVLAGGVDLSIDPFEMIGFAKTGALASNEMKVYDRDSNGFWPGEGSGVLVLMRHRDALARGCRIYASITGWGVSSDGKGGITRPEAAGHRLALRRAYQRAGYGPGTVGYFEGHGTGTAVGDATEIEALSSARDEDDPTAAPAALSTIKGNFGHTKAAAGAAGLIKASLAVFHQVIPPATGHRNAHSALHGDSSVYVPSEVGTWTAGAPVRAGVSAMGFGGINTHVTLEGEAGVRRVASPDLRTSRAVTGRQDREILMFDAETRDELRERVARCARLATRLSYAEVADMAAELSRELSGGPQRAAAVVSGPDDAARALDRLREALDNGAESSFDQREGVFLGNSETEPRITYLFPGQGTGGGTAGALRRRFPEAESVFATADLPAAQDNVATEVAQPLIVTNSLAGLRVLHKLGIEADGAVGHSLGELTALHWGGALDQQQLVRLATIRGAVMAAESQAEGTMAGLSCSPKEAQRFLIGTNVVIAGYNGPRQTVLAGGTNEIEEVCATAAARGVQTSSLNVSHAFHSPLVEPAAAVLDDRLAHFEFLEPRGTVFSTVTGERLRPGQDLRRLLREQITSPVRFQQAVEQGSHNCDLLIEVGPGRVLGTLAREIAPNTETVSMSTDSDSLSGLLGVVAAAFVCGQQVNTAALFEDRVVRPLSIDSDPEFLTNPCELVQELPDGLVDREPARTERDEQDSHTRTSTTPGAPPGEMTEPGGTLQLLRELAAERAELPLEAIGTDTHPLDDLHLSSITVGQLVNEVARATDRSLVESVPSFATARLGELAEMIDGIAESAADGDRPAVGEVSGVASWVTPFAVEYVDEPAPAPGGVGEPGEWTVFTTENHPLAKPLERALSSANVGAGVLLCLPPDCDEQHVELFLAAARATTNGTRFVVVQQGLGASGMAKTLVLEHPSIKTTIVELADVTSAGDIDTHVDQVVREVAATTEFAEVSYDSAGRRRVPELIAVTDSEPHEQLLLDETDVLLVTGGGKGITAECALAAAKDSGARLALVGRAEPEQDADLTANLKRLTEAGVEYRYQRADVSDEEQVRAAVGELQQELGPVTAVMHGAGYNAPAALSTLTGEEFRKALLPKVRGLESVLRTVGTSGLKLLVTFGSIIGRAGLRGEAHYATANDWMSELTRRFQAENPHVRAIAMEWSVWSGTGMGERLGVVEGLSQTGITPVSTRDGIDLLRRALNSSPTNPVMVICGRMGGMSTLPIRRPELPLTRFVERIAVHYPGVELITEADLSSNNDPYLRDHELDGQFLFPAVLGVEAMTQVAAALAGRTDAPLLEGVEFLRPVVVTPTDTNTIRVAALVRDPGTVDVVLRTSETGFGADHFRARVRFPSPSIPAAAVEPRPELPLVAVDPASELYGGLLFQGKRFQRLLGYHRSAARHAVADIDTRGESSWFAPFLPQELLLGDPGTRDTLMHALQCCVPDATLLPERVERLYPAGQIDQDSGPLVLDASELFQDGDSYVYDLMVRTTSGKAVERWEGLRLRAVRRNDGRGPWVPPMLGPYLERFLENVLGGNRAIVVEPDPEESSHPDVRRRSQTELAVSRALGRPVRLNHRPDGRPEVPDAEVSASHGAGLTLAAVSSEPVGCDVEQVVERTVDDWTGLLGPGLMGLHDLVTRECAEPPAVAGTRIWSALECLRKNGSMTKALVLERVHTPEWVLFSAGGSRIATFVTNVEGREGPVVFAFLEGRE